MEQHRIFAMHKPRHADQDNSPTQTLNDIAREGTVTLLRTFNDC